MVLLLYAHRVLFLNPRRGGMLIEKQDNKKTKPRRGDI
jgi:hypothetical protein